MGWNHRVRQFHRWMSVVFTAAVVVNIVALVREAQSVWVGFLALFPLALLQLTGIYLFVLPYVAKRRSEREAASAARRP